MKATVCSKEILDEAHKLEDEFESFEKKVVHLSLPSLTHRLMVDENKLMIQGKELAF